MISALAISKLMYPSELLLDNVPDAGNVVETIDRKTDGDKMAAQGLRGNYAMGLNEEDHQLFTVTGKNTDVGCP